ncbi:Glutamate--isopropylamine ligase [Defluviimonas aquaemixtae]|uniref:Glutamate--isopropylamine ligase n=1 Tax=Albidovulum aquaemixtae TaxID=1542388 RepID=A0A2R8BMG3_9RHOB|nr:glutamine synthetase family protein [Defluviimonas aquaemixtae]SPH24541.1 Glutamate--isopropylamine ligase [Defluviimonas aquaemixtae]
MPANLTFDTLKKAVAAGEIDTVLVCFPDMQGRLTGKRFVAQHFVESAWKETHCCNYLLALDVEMYTVPGYKSASWEKGYGDYTLKPDLTTLRRVPWLEGTAMVMADLVDHDTHEDIAVSPRAILKRQVARAKKLGFDAMMATELEFFIFQDSYDALNDSGYRDLQTLGRHNVDYAIFGTTKEEEVMRAIRNGLWRAGVPIENSKGEAEVGQEEVNAKYSDALDTCDNHVIIKNGVKEMCHLQDRSATFMAKYSHDRAGSSSHVHQSLWKAGKPAFRDEKAPHGMSALMRHYVAGQLTYAREITPLLAPFINSYKRFVVGLFAPTKAVWSLDNRTAGFRVCGEGTQAIRVECRIGGADLNPYLACAGLLAAGLAGIEQKLELEPAISGDIYHAKRAREIPKTLGEAAEIMNKSKMLRTAFGDDVVDHYVHAARWEIEEQNRVVTDWELKRGFERL